MDALENLLTRRSIRQFTDEPVAEEDVQTLFRAAMAAPSAGNAQPWHFVRIDDRAILRRIPEVQPHSRMLLSAPLAILVCADPSLEKYSGFWVEDCSAATENILLAAHAIGLGGVWLGLHPREDWCKGVADLLDLPPEIRPLSLVAVGHPVEVKEPPNRFHNARIHRNRW